MTDKIRKLKLQLYSSVGGAYTRPAGVVGGNTNGTGITLDGSSLKHYESPLATAVKKGDQVTTPMIATGTKLRLGNGDTTQPALAWGPHTTALPWNNGFSFSGTTNATNTLYTSINGAVVSQWMAAQLQMVSGSASTPSLVGISAATTGFYWDSTPAVWAVAGATAITKWISTGILHLHGSSASPSIAGTSAANTGLYWDSDPLLGVSVNGVGVAQWEDTAYRQPALAAPSSIVVGDQWNDSTQKCFIEYPNSIKQHRVGALFTQTASATIVDTITETTLFASGVGTLTLPADFFVAGKTVRLTLRGVYSEGAASNGTVNVKLGSTSICTTGAFAIAGAETNVGWMVTCDITCRSTGSTGTVFGQGMFLYSTNGQQPVQNTTTATIDTTGTLAIDVMWTWSVNNINNTITCSNATVEVLA